MSSSNDFFEQHVLECNPDPTRIVEGLRDTGYNFNTAIADIVDNSISANAKNVNILVNLDPCDNVTVYIADDGTGMDENGLINAMRYGSDVRANLASLGKFGLGLKTASTAFCRCLSVVTRAEGDDTVRKAQWDLDFVAQAGKFLLKVPPIKPEELEMLDNTAKGSHGTLVVWENVDRLLKSYKNHSNLKNAFQKKVNDLAIHLSMVYQRFLDVDDHRAVDVRITLNGNIIKPWDPFVTREEETKLVGSDTVEVELPNKTASSFIMNAYVLPRPEQFSSSKSRTEAMVGNDTQGFYIYRENRLIHYGDWMGIFSKEPHRSLLRVEFSFDHNLDEAFDVDIKKSRILPAEEIIEYISASFIGAPNREADERYRQGKKKAVSGKAAENDAHSGSNKNIDEKSTSVIESKTTIRDNQVEVENSSGKTVTSTIKIVSRSKPGQMYVIPTDDLEGGQLWQPCVVEGANSHAVRINQNHPYYQKIYYPVLNQNVLVTGMDALLWALAEAECSTINENTKEQYEEMRFMVSRILKKLVADLPDPDYLSDD